MVFILVIIVEQSHRSIYTLAPLFLVLIIDTMGVGLIFPVLSPLFLSKDVGMLITGTSLWMRDTLYGVTLTSFSLAMFFGASFLGDLSDVLGRRKVLLLCLLGTAAGLLLSAIAIMLKSVSLLLFSRLLAGFTAGSQPIAQAAIADISRPDKKAANFALITLANCVGFVLGPMLSGYLTNKHMIYWFNYSTPFYAAASLAFTNAVCLFFTFKETFFPKEKRVLNFMKSVTLLMDAFRNSRIRQLSIIYLLLQIGWGIYFQFLCLYLVQVFNYGPIQLGHFMSWLGLVYAVVLAFVVRIIAKHFNLVNITLFALLLFMVANFLSLLPGEIVPWLTVPLSAGGDALAYTALLALFSNSADSQSQGWVMGITGTVAAAAWGIAALLASMLAYVALQLPFITAGTALFIGAILMMKFGRTATA